MARIDLFQAPAWVTVMGKEVREAAKKGLLSAAIRTVSHIQNEIIPKEPRVPVDRGIYRAGWRAQKIPEGALVVNTVPHALFIEHRMKAGNVRAGQAMLAALTEWVRRKGLAGKGSLAGAEARRIAWAIAMSMKRKGIFDGGKGLHILEKATKQIPRFIDEEVKREISKL